MWPHSGTRLAGGSWRWGVRGWGWQVQPSSLGFIQVHQAESFDDVSSLPGWWQSARGAEGGRRGAQEPDGGSWGGPRGSWWGPRSQLDSDGPDLGMLRSCTWQSRGQPGQVAMETLSVCFLSEQGWPGADQIALGFTGMKVEPSCPK